MDARKLRIAPESLGSKLLLTEVASYKKYVDNKPTDEIEGYRYVVACVDHGLDKLSIKIPGKQLMDAPKGGFPTVTFTDLAIRPYVSSGQLALTATATGIALVK